LKEKDKISAIKEKKGVEQLKNSNQLSISKIKDFRKKEVTPEDLIKGILSEDVAALSRAITLIESTNEKHFTNAAKVIAACLPHSNKSIRIGITGVPGVGKSTFIESFGKLLTGLGKKVAVLAVDPSSSISQGSILGDKTRMEELVKDQKAFIRPSASGENLGGVARKTRETIILCEAFGFDTILIETVGVGQSEIAVHSMVDFFLLLKIAGAGDELQGIKRGIMEMADAIVINKADGDNVKKANMAKTEFGRALHFFPARESKWSPVTLTCSAISSEGLPEIWKSISDYFILTKNNHYFFENRKKQNKYWLLETINDQLKNDFYNNKKIAKLLSKKKKEVENNEISPFEAAYFLLNLYKTLLKQTAS
jgi:LAO/AO transport system kinase